MKQLCETLSAFSKRKMLFPSRPAGTFNLSPSTTVCCYNISTAAGHVSMKSTGSTHGPERMNPFDFNATLTSLLQEWNQTALHSQSQVTQSMLQSCQIGFKSKCKSKYKTSVLQHSEAPSTEVLENLSESESDWETLNAAFRHHLNFQDQTCVFFIEETHHLQGAAIICSSAVHLLSASAVWHPRLSARRSRLIYYRRTDV